MNERTLLRSRDRLARELTAWQAGALGLLLLASGYNAACASALMAAREQIRDQAVQLQQAECTRDLAVQELGALALQMEQAPATTDIKQNFRKPPKLWRRWAM